MDNRERARARVKTKEINFFGRKHQHFMAAVRKRGNPSGHQGENEQQRKKKVNRNT